MEGIISFGWFYPRTYEEMDILIVDPSAIVLTPEGRWRGAADWSCMNAKGGRLMNEW